MVQAGAIESPTSPLSGVRSYRLSYAWKTWSPRLDLNQRFLFVGEALYRAELLGDLAPGAGFKPAMVPLTAEGLITWLPWNNENFWSPLLDLNQRVSHSKCD